MKHLPIGAKVALWSALLAAVTMSAALVAMIWFLRTELLAGIEQRMDRTARLIFWHLDNQPDGLRGEISEATLPPEMASQLVEMIGPNDELLFRSAALRDTPLRSDLKESNQVMVKQRPYFLGASEPYLVAKFHHKTLTLFLAHPLRNFNDTLSNVKTGSLLAMGVVVLLGLFGGHWVANRAMKPIQTITEVARHISAEDLRQRLPVPVPKDEIRLLTKVLNETFDRLERSYLQATRFASDASHQLKTPITVMRVAIEAMLRAPDLGPEQTAGLTDLLDQTRRLSSLADGLLLLAKADAGKIAAQVGDNDIVPVIDSCVEDARILAAGQGIRIEQDLPPTLQAAADPHRTEQVLLNLLENAVKYNREGGRIHIRAGSRKDGVFIIIANTGTPIPPDRAAWIFDRFSRGDRFESRAGHGLGLSIARELAAAQGGDVRLIRSDAEWTEFEVRLRHPANRSVTGAFTPLLTPPPRRALSRNPS